MGMSWLVGQSVTPLAPHPLSDLNSQSPTPVGEALLHCLANMFGGVAVVGSMHRHGFPDVYVQSDAEGHAARLKLLGEGYGPTHAVGSSHWSWVDIEGQSLRMLAKATSIDDGTIVSAGLLFERKHDQICAVKSARDFEALIFAAIADSAKSREQITRLRACHETINAIDIGVVHIDADGRIVFENLAASEMLDANDAILRHGGSLRAANLADAVRLRIAIEHHASPAEGMRVAPIIALRRAKHSRPVYAVVVACGWHEIDPGFAASVYLVDPEKDIGKLISAACRLYGLTPVECELTVKIVAGMSLGDAASALKIKESTARTYLKSIFRKTGIQRQAALVTLIMASTINLNRSIVLAPI